MLQKPSHLVDVFQNLLSTKWGKGNKGGVAPDPVYMWL